MPIHATARPRRETRLTKSDPLVYDLAQEAYTAYMNSRDLPNNWISLPTRLREAWVDAVLAVQSPTRPGLFGGSPN